MSEHNEFPRKEVRQAITSGIEQAKSHNPQKAKTFKRPGYRKLIYSVVGAVAVFCILLVSSNYSPALASSLARIPVIGSVFGDSELIGLKQAQEKGLTSQIHETQTKNGISVTLDEILYDQNGIVIGWKVESDKPLKEGEINFFGPESIITFNGEIPDGQSGSLRETEKSPNMSSVIQEIQADDQLPDEFELGISLAGKAEERWYFSTPVKKISSIHTVPVKNVQKVDGIELEVEKLMLSDSGMAIAYKSKEKDNGFEMTRGDYIEFHVKDDQERSIKEHSGGTSGRKSPGNIIIGGTKKFDPIDPNVKELTITPYLALPTDGGGVEFDEEGNEKELSFKGNKLKEAKFESFKVKID